MPLTASPSRATAGGQRGFTLVELLVSMTITTVIMGATMVAMSDAIKATDSAMMLTAMNSGLRSSMDVIVRDLLQVGQGLPSGHVVSVPSGTGAVAVRVPGPPNSTPPIFTLPGAAEMAAVLPGPGLGPVINGVATDVITTLQADSTFDQIRLTALDPTGNNMTVWNPPLVGGAMPLGGANITNTGPDDVRPGDLMVLTKNSLSAFVQVTRVVGQVVYFDAGDSLLLNQQAATSALGTTYKLQRAAPVDVLPSPQTTPPTPTVTTQATRVRMITYYLDVSGDPAHPRLVRRINNGHPTTFDNTLGTAVAFDIEGLQISYDLADGSLNPGNVKMTANDLGGLAGPPAGRCLPSACNRNQIRKVNIVLSARSRLPLKGTRQFLRNRLQTQVSLRSLAFVDEYR